MNPGTSNNNERSGDRDMAFSNLMRKPRGIKACDYDPLPICKECQHPIVMWEVKRKPLTGASLMSNTKYTRIAADAFGVPAYFIYHQPEQEVVSYVDDDGEIIPQSEQPEPKLTVTRVNTGKFPQHIPFRQSQTFTYPEFVVWVENFATTHVCTEEHRERQARCTLLETAY
jgi:hypothetical protein